MNHDDFPKTCALVSSFVQRKPMINAFIAGYAKTPWEVPLYIFSDDQNRELSCADNVIHVVDNFHANRDLGDVPEWGQRLKNALNFLRRKDYEYVFFLPDDALLFFKIDMDRMKKGFLNLSKHRGDCFSLTQDWRRHGIETTCVEEDFNLAHYTKQIPCWVTHQPCLWKLDSLDKLTTPTDISKRHEGMGFSRAAKENFSFYQFSGPWLTYGGIRGANGTIPPAILHEVQAEFDGAVDFSELTTFLS